MTRYLAAGAIAFGFCFGAMSVPASAEAPATVVNIAKPAAGTPILVVLPQVSLGLLTASGATEPKDEWSQSARKYIAASMAQNLETRQYKTASVDVDSYEDPRAVQILKLNSAVTDSIASNAGLLSKLPTKTGFDWTVGDGAVALVPAGADSAAPAYALFVEVNGNYASAGRAAVMVGMALLHTSVSLGGQYVRGTLVDLKTGQVVWYNLMIVPSGTDIRTPGGAASAVGLLFKKLPL